MKMQKLVFDGTPEEFKAVAFLFGEGPFAEESIEATAGGKEAPAVEPVEALRQMLTRPPMISESQLAVFKALEAGKVEWSEFLRRTGHTARQMAGVLGAIGKRANGTKEIHNAKLPGNTRAVYEWHTEKGKEYLSLTSHALEAWESLKAQGVF